MILDRGQEIERYVVEGVLGEGGMAVVYRVRHRTLGSVFALKVLTIPNRRIRDRMLQEGRIQARIRHSNVVHVVDVLDVGGMTGLLMELVPGPTLEALLEQHLPALDDALALFGGILAGVDAAHAIGLVHRDLKPENVLLRLADDGLVPQITDFGIAKQGEDGAVQATRPGATMGTPSYMAPEQARDASGVTTAADVYSLGVVLYELVTGHKAFPGNNALDICNAVVAGDFVPPEAHRPDLPAPVLAAIRGAMHLEPALRIQSCLELAAVLAGRPVVTVADALPTRLSLRSPVVAVARGLSRRTTTPVQQRRSGAPTLSADTLLKTRGQETPPPATGRHGVETRIAGPLVALVAAAALSGWWWTRAGPEPIGGATPAAPDGTAAPIAGPPEPFADAPQPEAVAPEIPPVPEAAPTSGRPERPTTSRPSAPATPAPDAAAPPPHDPTPSPEPPEEPSGRRERPGRLKVEGPATKVMLQDGDQFYNGNGRIPAGRYTVLAWYGTPVPKAQGRVTLVSGETVTLACEPTWTSCRRK